MPLPAQQKQAWHRVPERVITLRHPFKVRDYYFCVWNMEASKDAQTSFKE